MDDLYRTLLDTTIGKPGLPKGNRSATSLTKLHDIATECGWRVWFRMVRLDAEPHTISVSMRVSKREHRAAVLWDERDTKLRWIGGVSSPVEGGRRPTFPTQKSFIEYLQEVI